MEHSISTETILRFLLPQIIFIMALAKAAGWTARQFKQPVVVGEIIAGILLGPSFFGYFFPEISQYIFHPEQAHIGPAGLDSVLNLCHSVLAQLGLIFLLFLIGLEFDFTHLRIKAKATLLTSITGLALPFALGQLLSPYLYSAIDTDVPYLGFSLFVSTALSITAIPILGRMMVEMGITQTKIGTITIGAAAIDDAIGWMLLAAICSIVTSSFNIMGSLFMLVETLVFTCFLIYVVGPFLRSWIRKQAQKKDKDSSIGFLSLILISVFLSATCTNIIGIFAIFGSFLLGAVLSPERKALNEIKAKFQDFIATFFLPIFFTYTGLRTDIGSLDSVYLWILCLGVLVVAVTGKLAGCTWAAWIGGFKIKDALCVGIMMNTRALMELIVLNIGYELGVIPASVYTMLVMMAIATTLMTCPLLQFFSKGSEIELHLKNSGFLKNI